MCCFVGLARILRAKVLLAHPSRVVRAWTEFCSGYQENPAQLLERTFEEVEGYDDMVMLRNIRLESHCEHHLVPILGVAHIAYVPNRRVVGISKLARVLDGFHAVCKPKKL